MPSFRELLRERLDPADAKFVKEHQRAIRALPDPTIIPRIIDRRISDVERPQEAVLGGQRRSHFASMIQLEYIRSIEAAYYQNRGGLSVEWLSQQHPDDLVFFTDPDFADEGISDLLLNQGQAFIAAQRERRKIETLAEKLYQDELARQESYDEAIRRSLVFGVDRRTGELPPFIADLNQNVDELEAQLPEGATFRPEDLEDARRLLAGEESEDYLGKLAGGLLKGVFSTFAGLVPGGGALTKFLPENEKLATTALQTGLTGIGTAFQWGTGLLSGAAGAITLNFEAANAGFAQLLGPNLSERWLGYRVPDSPEIAELQQRRREIQTGEARADLKELARTDLVPGEIWLDWQLNHPERIEEYVQTFGPDLAMEAFFVEFQDYSELPEIEAQLEDWVTFGVERPLESMIDSLREQNFRDSDSILKGLGSYGRFVDGIGASIVAAAIGLKDSEAQEMLQELRYEDFVETMAVEVEEGGHTASGVLGIDGTFSGLLLNFGLGAILDPTNWIWGPKLKRGVNGLSSRAAVSTAMRTWAVRLGINELPSILASQMRSPMGKASLTAPFFEVGLGGELLEAAGYGDSVLPGTPWLNTETGKHGWWADANFVDSLLDDVQRQALDSVNPKTVETLQNSLHNNSFLEPLVLEYDIATQTVRLAEGGGLKRLAAVRGMDDVNQVPIVFKQVDSTTAPIPRPLLEEIISKPDDFVYHGTTTRAAEQIEGLRPGKPGLREGGLTHNQKSAATFAKERRATESGEGVVLVFRKSDLPPFVQRALEKGDVLDLFEGRDATGIPPIRPVASYSSEVGLPTSLPRGPQGVPLSELGVDPPTALRTHSVGEAEFFHPHEIFTDAQLGLKADKAALTEVVEEALLRGADVPFARQTWAAVGLGRLFRSLARTTIGKHFTPWLRTVHNVDVLPVSGVGGSRSLVNMIEFFGSRDGAWAGRWINRVLGNEQALGRVRVSVYKGSSRLNELRRIDLALSAKQLAHSPWAKEVAEQIGAPFLAKSKTIDEARRQLRNLIRDEEALLADAARSSAGAMDWKELIDEMLLDYNTTFIASHPAWKDAVEPHPVTGQPWVPWNKIHRGVDVSEAGFVRPKGRERRQVQLADQVKQQVDLVEARTALGEELDLASTLEQFRVQEGGLDTVQLPASPIELVAAAEMGGAAYTKWSSNLWGANLGHTLHLIDSLWKTNVLLTPRTFAVMSIDELTTLLHHGGVDFIRRYLTMRANSIRARLVSLATEGTLKRGPGASKLSPRTQQMLRELNDLPDEVLAYESMLSEHVTREPMLMEPGDLGYAREAQKYARSFLANPAFRSFLRGKDSFLEWFASREGQLWQLNTQVRYRTETGRAATRPLLDAEEGWQMLENTWKYLEAVARKQGLDAARTGEFRQAWGDTAALYDADAAGRIFSVPEWLVDYFGPIKGIQPIYPGASPLWQVSARAFEMGAAHPANFRQALASQMMRDAELVRLRSLFEDRGFSVLGDNEVMQMLKERGFDVQEVNQFTQEWVDQALMRQGFITEGYISKLAEARAADFVDQSTYAFEQGTRAGSAGKGIWPFGRAWGDMYARWFRALGSRAIARKWLGKGAVSGFFQKVADISPVNPRTAGFLSRVSASSFELERGFTGEEEVDLSGLTFLPTADQGGLSALVPGLGLVGVGLVDGFINLFGPDPVADPIEYEQLIEAMSDIIPTARFHGRGPAARTVGGGNLGRLLSITSSFFQGVLHNNNRDQWRWTGDIQQELTRSRAVSAQFADPDLWAEILSNDDPEIIEMLLLNATHKAWGRAAGTSALEQFTSFLLPARAALDTSLDEVYEVWVRTAEDMPEFFDVEIPGDEDLKRDPDLLLRTGDRIRRQYLNLPDWQKDLLMAVHPELAVNLVSTWEWSDTVPEGTPGMDMPYRSVGSAPDDESLSEALTRHSNYVTHGWVVPQNTALRGYNIVGTALQARDNVTRYLYETVAQEMNDARWEILVSDQTKKVLELALTDPMIKRLNISNPKLLWEKWGTFRGPFIEQLHTELGIEDNEDAQRELAKLVRIPEDEEAWSEMWRGDDMEEFAQRMREAPVFLSPESQTIIKALELPLEEGISGEDFLNALIDYRFQNVKGAAWHATRLQFGRYQDERGAAFTAGMQMLSDLTHDTTLDRGWRQQLDELMTWMDLQAEKFEGVPRSVQDEAVDRFNRIATVGRNAPVSWDKIWHLSFQGRFGPRDWEPPTPAPVYREDGQLNANAWSPHIRTVVDGDTLMVSKYRGPSLFGDVVVPGFGDVRGEVGTGETRVHQVRLLGVMAADFSRDTGQAEQHKRRLEDALENARRNGSRIWLVRDPSYAGSNTDPFGRELAWLWIGDDPYYFPESLERGQ